jgi:hypothetical protein
MKLVNGSWSDGDFGNGDRRESIPICEGVPELEKVETVHGKVATQSPEVDTTETKKRTDLDAYSIEEFCRRHSISRATYYNLKLAGKAPREGHALGRVLITKEAALEWRINLP